MKVLLIVPWILAKYVGPVKPTCPHTGVSYIAALLLKNNHQVVVWDMRITPQLSKLIKKINEFNPDFIGITCVSMDYLIVYQIIDEITNKFNIPIIIGGPHISVIRKNVLIESKADFAIIGEGEYTLLELVEGKPYNTIDGLIWRKNREIITNKPREYIQNLDKLPFPAYELSPLNKYIDRKISIVSSRGCPYKCIYCSIQMTVGSKFRARSAENVVNEIKHWYQKGYTYFQFTDDNFSFDMKRAEKICDLILKNKMRIRWDLRNGIRVNKVDYNLLKKMKKSGCFFIAYGIESANQEVLNTMKKGITIEQARNAVKLTKQVGIKVGAFFLIGTPKDTFQRFMESLNFAKSLDLDEMRFYNVMPYPGTELFTMVKKQGTFLRKPKEYLNNFTYWSNKPIFETKEFPKHERVKAIKIGEKYVMKYLLKREFGSFFGYIGFVVWNHKFLREKAAGPAMVLWKIIRKLK